MPVFCCGPNVWKYTHPRTCERHRNSKEVVIGHFIVVFRISRVWYVEVFFRAFYFYPQTIFRSSNRFAAIAPGKNETGYNKIVM